MNIEKLVKTLPPPEYDKLPSWSTLVTILGVMFGSWLIDRSRSRRVGPRFPARETPPHQWHTCFASDCRTLVRPREVLCAAHLCRVPVSLRMAIARLTTPAAKQSAAWLYAAEEIVLAFELSEDLAVSTQAEAYETA